MSVAMLKQERVTLEGLTCSNCAAKIEKAFNKLDYIESAVLNFATSKVTLVFNDRPMTDFVAELQRIVDDIETGVVVRLSGDSQAQLERQFQFKGLACSSCAAKIEAQIRSLSSVKEAELNFATSKVRIVEKQATQGLLEKVQAIVNNIEPGVIVEDVTRGVVSTADASQTHHGHDHGGLATKKRLIIGSIIFALAVGLAHLPQLQFGQPYWVELVAYAVSYFLIGGPVVLLAIRNIARGRVFDENFLMTIATVGAFAIGEYPEGVAVMLFYMIGELFQEKAVDKSRRSIKELMDIRPDYANLRVGDETKIVSPETVTVGSIIVVKPGEKVPLDGTVVEGTSMIDTSALTGESVPRRVKPGERVLSGTINKEGLLVVEVAKEFGQSTVSKILDLVENASAKKAPTEKFITKFAAYYTPAVVFSALALAVIPPLVISGASFSEWFYRALVFLVISCPCALVVSIPLGFFGGIGRASKQGILVKGGNYLEALNDVKTIVFDKTGTLTKGVFAVSKVNPVAEVTDTKLLEFAAYAEAHSNHPIAKSIIEHYDAEIDESKISSYQEISGQGIQAVVADKTILAGNHRLMVENDIVFEAVSGGATIVYLAVDGQYLGYISIADQLKDDSYKAIQELHHLGINNLIMLTGDREPVAAEVAKALGLDNYYAELLPHQKVELVEEQLQKLSKKEKLVFVGDGINDAPVLARSDIGVAMGGLGSDAAIEAADVVLMTDEPGKLATAFETAKVTRAIVWQNIVFSLGVKGIVLLLGALGLANMWGAVFADVGVALIAVLNAMRITRV